MKKKWKSTLALLLAGSLVAGTAVCYADEQSSSSDGKSLTIGWSTAVSKLNPLDTAFSVNSAPNYATELLYLPLVQLDEDGTYKPQLADSVTTEDNVHFTAELNSDAVWTDGEPVTADDVLFSLDLITNPATGSSIAYLFNLLEGTDEAGLQIEGEEIGAVKVDDHTVDFTVKEPVSISIFDDFIAKNLKAIPNHIYSDLTPETALTDARFTAPEVTNGPFVLKEFVDGQYVIFAKNTGYFRGEPKLDTLTIRTLSSTELSVELLNGGIDMNWPGVANISASDYETIENAENLVVTKDTPYAIRVLWINDANLPDARVRRAISLAIDRETIVNGLLKGYAEALQIPITSDSPYYDDSIYPTQDIEAAKELLKEAEWDESRTLVFRVPDSNAATVNASNIIVENLKAVGIQAQIETADFATTVAAIRSEQDYDLGILGISAPANEPSPMLEQLFKSGSAMNYNNPAFDELLEKARNYSSQEEAEEIYAEIKSTLLEDMPAVCVYVECTVVAVNERVTHGYPKKYGAFIDVQEWDAE